MLGFLGYALLRQNIPAEKDEQKKSDSAATNGSSLPTKTSAEGGMTVKVTPRNIVSGSLVWEFAVVLDTHTGALDTDLVSDATLVAGGKTYQPIRWDGDPPGGHHREGMLVFDAADPMPAYMELKIKNVGGIPERQFMWDVK